MHKEGNMEIWGYEKRNKKRKMKPFIANSQLL
jgi:hypothetical protein